MYPAKDKNTYPGTINFIKSKNEKGSSEISKKLKRKM